MYRNKLAALVLGLGTLGSCNLQKGGLVFFAQDGYEAQIVATSAGGGFGAADGIVCRGTQFLLADEGGHCISVLDDLAGHATIHTTAKVKSPEDIVVADDGTAFFTDDDAGGVWQFSSDGRVTALVTADQGLKSTEGIAIMPSGNLAVGDGEMHTLFEVTRSGKVSTLLGPEAGISKPESLAYDAEGNLYIADNRDNVIYLLDPNHHLRKLLTAKDALGHPESICFARGTLYITDSEAGKLSRFDVRHGLQTIAVFSGRLENIQGITAMPDGSLLLTVQDLKRNLGMIVHVWQSMSVTPSSADVRGTP